MEIEIKNEFLKDGREMDNFPVKINGKEYWISRSIAVCGFIFKRINDKWFVLCNKRGQGCPDFKGYWNVICGYLQFNRTCVQQMMEEAKEECGFISREDEWTFIGYNDSPHSNKQNVTMRFLYICNSTEDYNWSNKSGGEENEVDDIRWISVDNLDSFDFAFDHREMIEKAYNEYILNG